MKRKTLIHASVFTLSCVLTIAAGELYCRHTNRPNKFQPIMAAMDPLTRFAVADPFLGYSNRPNESFTMRQVVGSPVSTTDQYGYRNGYKWPADTDIPIILFVGDSVTFGAEVNDDETIPSEVAKLLDGKAACCNTASRGYNTVQAKRSIELALERFPDRIVMVFYVYCGNDPAENVVPDVRWPLPVPILVESTDGYQESLSETSLAWGSFIENWTNPNPPSSSWLISHSALYMELSNTIAVFGDSPPGSPGQRHCRQYAEAVCEWARNHGSHDAFVWILQEMNELCSSRNIVFLVAPHTYGTPHDHYPQLHSACDTLGIRCIDPSEHFPLPRDEYFAPRVDGTLDPHYNHAGTKAFADGVVSIIESYLH